MTHDEQLDKILKVLAFYGYAASRVNMDGLTLDLTAVGQEMSPGEKAALKGTADDSRGGRALRDLGVRET